MDLKKQCYQWSQRFSKGKGGNVFPPLLFYFFGYKKVEVGIKKNMGSMATPHIEINMTNRHQMNEIPDIRLLNE